MAHHIHQHFQLLAMANTEIMISNHAQYWCCIMFYINQSWWTFTCPSPLSHAAAAVSCSSRKLKTPRSLFSLPLYKGTCTPPHELLEWSRTEIDCGDSGGFVMWDTRRNRMLQWCRDAELRNQSNPTSCYSTHQSRCLSRSWFSRQVTSAAMRKGK